jgi:hypothetical protein
LQRSAIATTITLWSATAAFWRTCGTNSTR